jgi:phage gpG-like protein
MTPAQFAKHLASLEIYIKKAIDEDIPKRAGNEAARLFRQNFQQEGFFGQKWKDVQRRGTKTATYKTKSGKFKTKTVTVGKGVDGSRKILTGRTGDLGRSIKVATAPGTAIIYSDIKYSRAHNDGTANAGRGRRTTIPQRRFIGDSPELQTAVRNTIEAAMSKLFK